MKIDIRSVTIVLASMFTAGCCAKAISKKVIVVGGITDIGRELAKQCLQKGYTVGFLDENKIQLEAFKTLENDNLVIEQADFADAEQSRLKLQHLIDALGGMDICIIAISTAPEVSHYGLLKEGDIPWNLARETIVTNILVAAALSNLAFNYFLDQGAGHLVGVSSLDALSGHPGCPAYTASKAFMANYLGGMRKKMRLLKYSDIFITDLRWSFIQDSKQSLTIGWVETPQEAALHMMEAIEQKKAVAYIMSKMSFIIWGLLAVPSMVRDMLSGVSVLKKTA